MASSLYWAIYFCYFSFNTYYQELDKEMNFNRPMLAADVELSKIQYPVICMPKIDGVRAVNPYGHICARSFKHFRNTKINEVYNNSDFKGFDGEFVVGSPVDKDCCRITTSNVSSVDGECPDWHLFDYVNDYTYKLPYSYRLNALKEEFNNLKDKHPFIKLIKWAYIEDEENLLKYEQEMLNEGYEGIVIRDVNAPYKFGRSTVKEQGLLRLKRFSDTEAVVEDVIEAYENRNEAYTNMVGLTERATLKENKVPKGIVGSFLCSTLKDIVVNEEKIKKGTRIIVSAGKLTKEEKEYLFKNKNEVVGKVIKFKYFPKGVKDTFRFPTFQSFRDKEDM